VSESEVGESLPRFFYVSELMWLASGSGAAEVVKGNYA